MAQQIAFVDTRLSDWQILVTGVEPDTAVVLLDPLTDGLSELTQIGSSLSHLL
jgi:uncharacterized protein DUF4347